MLLAVWGLDGFKCPAILEDNYLHYNWVPNSPWLQKDPSCGERNYQSFVLRKKTFDFISEPVNNAVIVSRGQQRDSAAQIHVSILPQTPLPSKLPYNAEQTSLCHTVGLCLSFILNTVWTSWSQTPYPLSLILLPCNHKEKASLASSLRLKFYSGVCGGGYYSSVQLLSCVRLFATPWTAGLQASLSIANSKFTQTHVYWVGDAVQPSHLLSSPSPSAFNLSQHQGLFQCVSSSH